MARARAGQRRVARDALELRGVDRVGRHDGLPLGPLAVADLDGDGSAERAPVAHAAEDAHGVLLELHPRAAAHAEPAAREIAVDVGGGDGDAGGQALEDRRPGQDRATPPRSTSATWADPSMPSGPARREGRPAVRGGPRRAGARCGQGVTVIGLEVQTATLWSP